MRNLLLFVVLLGAAAVAAAQTLISEPVKIPSGIFTGITTVKVQPEYPAAARQAHVEGSVTMRVLIDIDGHIQQVDCVSGPAMLADAAMDAVKQWTYAPYLIDGLPRSVSTLVTVNFAFARRAASNDDDALAVGPQVMAPRLRKFTDPTLAHEVTSHGIVRLSVGVDSSGGVKTVTALEGQPDLVAVAQSAVSQWEYSPYLVRGAPVSVKTNVSFDF